MPSSETATAVESPSSSISNQHGAVEDEVSTVGESQFSFISQSSEHSSYEVEMTSKRDGVDVLAEQAASKNMCARAHARVCVCVCVCTRASMHALVQLFTYNQRHDAAVQEFFYNTFYVYTYASFASLYTSPLSEPGVSHSQVD